MTCKRGLLTGLLVVVVLCGALLAAKTPVDCTNSYWETGGPAKAKIQRSGSVKGWMDGYLYMGPGYGLGANEFQLDLDDGYDTITVEGTWQADAKGKLALSVNRVALEQSLESVFGPMVNDLFYAQTGMYPDDWWIDVPNAQVKAKPKSKRGVETMKLKTKFTFYFKALFGTEVVSVKAAMSIKGAGYRE